jgi:small subunit ribosomal protein S1
MYEEPAEKQDEAYWRALLGTEGAPFETPPLAAKPPEAASPSGVSAEQTTTRLSRGWAKANESYTQEAPLELKVVAHNRGGVLVQLEEIRGFVPASQLASLPRRMSDEERLAELAHYVGKTLCLKVVELNQTRNRLILSERIATPPAARADQVWASLAPDQRCRGVVRNVTDFGAFVDLGGVEGLIHVSEMAWQRVNHPRDLLTPGQEVEVYILAVNREERRVALSLKRLTPDPWMVAAQTYHPGDLINVTITRLAPFGAFAKAAEGVEGLIHVSELAEGNFLHPQDVVQQGQVVQARVVSIDPARQRLSLSLRPASPPPAAGQPPATRLPPPPPDAGYWDSLVQNE